MEIQSLGKKAFLLLFLGLLFICSKSFAKDSLLKNLIISVDESSNIVNLKYDAKIIGQDDRVDIDIDNTEFTLSTPRIECNLNGLGLLGVLALSKKTRNNYIITNHHLLEKQLCIGGKYIAIFTDIYQNKHEYDTVISAISENQDIMALSVVKNDNFYIDNVPVLIPRACNRRNLDVFFNNNDAKTMITWRDSKYKYQNLSYSIVGIDPSEISGVFRAEHIFDTNKGSSGGPIISSDGVLEGINRAAFNDSDLNNSLITFCGILGIMREADSNIEQQEFEP